MAIVTGDNIILLVGISGGPAVAVQCQTSSSIEMNNEQLEVICKDGTGDRGISSIGTFIRWTASLEGYLDNDASLGYSQLFTASLTDENVTLAFEITDPDGTVRTITGEAKISSLSISAPNKGEIGTWSASLQGIGVPTLA